MDYSQVLVNFLSSLPKVNYFQVIFVSFIASLIVCFLHNLFQNLNLYKSKLSNQNLFFIILILSAPFTYLHNRFYFDPYLLGLVYSFFLLFINSIIILPILRKGFFGYKISKQFILSNLIIHAVYGLILGILVNL